MFEVTSVLIRRWRLVVLLDLVLIALGAAILLTDNSRTYTASSQVLFDQPALLGNVAGLNVPSKFAALGPTFCRLLQGDEVLPAVADEAAVSEETVTRELECVPVQGTTIVVVRATTHTPQLSQALSNAGAQVLAREVTARYNPQGIPEREQVVGSVLQSADRPGADPKNTRRQLILVFVGATFVAVAFVIAAEPYRRGARDREREASAVNDAEPA